jgi:L-glyceraldehyde 3-phosphate reductase
MALAWTLRDRRVTSALIGASSVSQLEEKLQSPRQPAFGADERAAIDRFATDSNINIWTERAHAERQPQRPALLEASAASDK